MAGSISFTVPVSGGTNATQEPLIPTALTTLRDALNAVLDSSNAVDGAQIGSGTVPNSAIAAAAGIPISKLNLVALSGDVTSSAAGVVRMATEHGYLAMTGADNTITSVPPSWQDVLASLGNNLQYTTVTAGVFEVTASLIISAANNAGEVSARLLVDGSAQAPLIRMSGAAGGSTLLGNYSQTWQVSAGAGKIIKVQAGVSTVVALTGKVLTGSSLAVKRIA